MSGKECIAVTTEDKNDAHKEQEAKFAGRRNKGVVVKTIIGRPYSVERYYMLSEIEQHAIHPVYLDDYYKNDNANEDSDGNNGEGNLSLSLLLPPYIILYLLWDFTSGSLVPSTDDGDDDDDTTEVQQVAAESFRKDSLHKAIGQLDRLITKAKSTPKNENKNDTAVVPVASNNNVYIVVDMLIPESSSSLSQEDNTDGGEDNEDNKVYYGRYIKVAEELVKQTTCSMKETETKSYSSTTTTTTTSYTSINLLGMTVGIVNHPRAAPGLESCLDAIMVGSKDRRWYRNYNANNNMDKIQNSFHSTCSNYARTDGINKSNEKGKSCVGIVSNRLEDFLGFDTEGETDAVQNVFQSRSSSVVDNDNDEVVVEGEGVEPILEFANQAHKYWRVNKIGLPAEPTLAEIQSNNKLNGPLTTTSEKRSKEEENNMLVTIMVWITAIGIGLLSYYMR